MFKIKNIEEYVQSDTYKVFGVIGIIKDLLGFISNFNEYSHNFSNGRDCKQNYLSLGFRLYWIGVNHKRGPLFPRADVYAMMRVMRWIHDECIVW